MASNQPPLLPSSSSSTTTPMVIDTTNSTIPDNIPDNTSANPNPSQPTLLPIPLLKRPQPYEKHLPTIFSSVPSSPTGTGASSLLTSLPSASDIREIYDSLKEIQKWNAQVQSIVRKNNTNLKSVCDLTRITSSSSLPSATSSNDAQTPKTASSGIGFGFNGDNTASPSIVSASGSVIKLKLSAFPKDSDLLKRKSEDSSIISSSAVPSAPPPVSKPLTKSGSQTLNKKKKKKGRNDDGLSTSPPNHHKRTGDEISCMVLTGDFSKLQKPAHQSLLADYWKYMEQYFRSLNDDDLKLLETEEDEFSPYVTPPVGKLYTDVWMEEDTRQVRLAEGKYQYPDNYIHPREYYESPQDGIVWPGEIYFGSLTERIVASLVEEKMMDVNGMKNFLEFGGGGGGNSNSNSNKKGPGNSKKNGIANVPIVGATLMNKSKFIEGQDSSMTDTDGNNIVSGGEEDDLVDLFRERSATDMETLEERIKKELWHLGIIPEEEMAPAAEKTNVMAEDDELGLELQALQRELREVSGRNKERKQRLLDVAKSYKLFEEYYDGLDAISKQLETGYAKRTKSKKAKSKKPTQSRPMSDGLSSILRKRREFLRVTSSIPFGKLVYAPPERIFGPEPPTTAYSRLFDVQKPEVESGQKRKADEAALDEFGDGDGRKVKKERLGEMEDVEMSGGGSSSSQVVV